MLGDIAVHLHCACAETAT